MAKKKNNAEKIRTIIDSTDIESLSANIEQNYIFTTEDKVRILYDEYSTASKSSGNIFGWLGIFITLLASDITCQFNSILKIDAATVAAIFYVCTVISFAFLIKSIVNWFKNKEKLSFNFFIKKLKGDNEEDDILTMFLSTESDNNIP